MRGVGGMPGKDDTGSSRPAGTGSSLGIVARGANSNESHPAKVTSGTARMVPKEFNWTLPQPRPGVVSRSSVALPDLHNPKDALGARWAHTHRRQPWIVDSGFVGGRSAN